MRRAGWIGVIGLCGLFFLAGAATEEKIHYPVHGFTIAPLESDEAGATGRVMTMFLPGSDDTSPYVNITAHATPVSIDDYIAGDKRRFENSGYQVITAEKKGDDAGILEYTGKLINTAPDQKDTIFHMYAKVVKRGPRILLATAVVPDKQWAEFFVKLKGCVDTFEPIR